MNKTLWPYSITRTGTTGPAVAIVGLVRLVFLRSTYPNRCGPKMVAAKSVSGHAQTFIPCRSTTGPFLPPTTTTLAGLFGSLCAGLGKKELPRGRSTIVLVSHRKDAVFSECSSVYIAPYAVQCP